MGYACTLRTVAPQPVLCIRVSTTSDELAHTIGTCAAAVWQHLHRSRAIAAGPPYTRYLYTKEGRIEIEVGFPIEEPVPGDGLIRLAMLPGGEVVATVHVGPYERLPEAGAALDAWAREHGREPAGPAWELYVRNAGDVNDPSEFLTEVIRPLAPPSAMA